MKSFQEKADELRKQYNCKKHEFEENPCGFITLKRFGGKTIPIYKCKKCKGVYIKG